MPGCVNSVSSLTERSSLAATVQVLGRQQGTCKSMCRPRRPNTSLSCRASALQGPLGRFLPNWRSSRGETWPQISRPLVFGHEIAGEVTCVWPGLAYASWAAAYANYVSPAKSSSTTAATTSGVGSRNAASGNRSQGARRPTRKDKPNPQLYMIEAGAPWSLSSLFDDGGVRLAQGLSGRRGRACGRVDTGRVGGGEERWVRSRQRTLVRYPRRRAHGVCQARTDRGRCGVAA
jgi:hypothetical protein